ncbi:MAG TPA: septation protein SepH [Streptosporangiaceae bacterium]
MQELRFVAVSEDGSYAVLAIPGRSGRFMLPIDDRLRAVAKGQFSRLAQYEIEVENPLRPKEIQARIRAGETVEEIADAAGIPVDRVRWFEGPVLAERAYVADQAQRASVRRQGDSTPGPHLGDIVAERLTGLGADPEDAQWDSRKHGDGSWQVQLAFRTGGRLHIAEWLFDPRRRHVSPADDNAERLSLPDAELPPTAGGSLGAATVTPIRPRPERPAVPPRQAAPPSPQEPDDEPADEPAEPPVQEPVRAAARGLSAAPAGPASPARPPAARTAPPAATPEPDRPPRPSPAQRPAAQAPAPPAPSAPPARSAPPREAPPAEAPQPEAPRPEAPRPEAPAAHAVPQAPAAQAGPPPADEPAQQPPARGRGKKAAQRGRRSSVPSWDEIMLGNNRQPE